MPLIYSEVYGFSEGLCAAVRWEYKEDGSLDSSSRCDVFVDKNGREVIRLKKNMFVFSSSRFSEGLCPVRTEDNMFGRCVYITQTGKQVIENGGWSNSGGSFKKGIAVTTTATSGAMNHNMETYGVIKYLGNQKDGLIISVTFGSTRYVLNGEPFDQNTMVYNGVAYLPAAYLATKLGLTARWDAATNTTTLTSTGAKPPANSGTSVVPASNPVTKTIMATFGTTKYFLNGEPFEQDTMVYEGVAYLPAAYLAEKLGLTAKWDAKTNITTLTSIN